MHLRTLTFVSVVTIGLLLGAPAQATLFHLGGLLTGDQEVPPVVTEANGLATIVYNDVTNTFDITVLVSGIEPGDLAPNPAQFHLHGPAPAGGNAGVLVDLGSMGAFSAFPVPGGLLSFQLSDVPFPAANEADLLNGLTYLNLHTTDFPSGEVRGQMLIPEPTTALLLGIGLTGIGVAGRTRKR